MDTSAYLPFLIALGLGLLVGLQREWRGSEVAGIRTFALITLLGTVLGSMSGDHFVFLAAAGFLGIALLLVVANVAKLAKERAPSGLTTEIAALLMYSVGVALTTDWMGPAIVTAGVTAVLLHWKQPMHQFVQQIGEQDFRGLIQMVLIALVILPLLPNETFDPYHVLNPFKIWTMVVLIVGISMAAYVVYKLVGPGAGAILGGVLGGLISSTATTVSYARLTKSDGSLVHLAALVILVASTILNVRVLFELGVAAPGLLHLPLFRSVACCY